MEINDLLTLKAHEEGAYIHIKKSGAKKADTDFYIKVIGPDSKEFRKQWKSLAKDLTIAKDSNEQMEKEREFLVNLTIGWKGLFEGEEEVPFTKEKCSWLYENAPYIQDQVDNFVVNSQNFIKG